MARSDSDRASDSGSDCGSLSALSRGGISGSGRFPETPYARLHEDLSKFSWTLQLEDLWTCLQATVAIFEDYDRRVPACEVAGPCWGSAGWPARCGPLLAARSRPVAPREPGAARTR